MPKMMDDEIMLASGEFSRKGDEFDLHVRWKCCIPFQDERFYDPVIDARFLCTHSDMSMHALEELWRGNIVDGENASHVKAYADFGDSEGLYIRLTMGCKKAKKEFLRRAFRHMNKGRGLGPLSHFNEMREFVTSEPDAAKFEMDG